MKRRRFERRRRPDTTTGSRAGYSGTRRATTRWRPWSRGRSWRLAAAVAASVHARLHLGQILVELSLLICSGVRADFSRLPALKIHHFGAGRLIRWTTSSLSRFAKLQLLRRVLLADGFDLGLLRVRQVDVLEKHSAHSAP